MTGRRLNLAPAASGYNLQKIAAALCIALVAGCGSGAIPASGRVERDGKAVSAGKVMFSPIGEGKIAVGPIQPDGTFQLTTSSPNDGALAGKYRVMVAGDRTAADKALQTTYLAPNELEFEVISGADNKFTIDIRVADGWQAVGHN